MIVLTVLQHIQAALAYPWPGARYETELKDLDTAAQDTALALAAEGVDLASAARLRAQPLVRRASGAIWRTILDAADDLDAGVIVFGSRGRGDVQSMMRGSVSGAALHHAHRPLLVVRHGAIKSRHQDDSTPQSLAGPIIGLRG